MNEFHQIRIPVSSDINFIYNSWGKTLHTCEPYNFIPNELFFAHQNAIIENCLAKYRTLIICLADEPDEIVGYINYLFYNEILIINYAYIKKAFRKMGEMGELIEKLYPDSKMKPIILTCFNKHYVELKKKYNLHFDPYFLMEH